MLKKLFGTIFGREQPAAPAKQDAAPGVQATAAVQTSAAEDCLDDVTFIGEVRRSMAGPWHQYDFRLLAQPYGWEMMCSWVDYIFSKDLVNNRCLWRATMGANETEVTQSYRANGCKASQTPELQAEGSMLSVAGLSETLRLPVKIVWMNQTKLLRIFTIVDDERLIRRYAETVVRRSFGKPEAMKPGRPPETT